jgi:hypothetical protein
MDRAQFFAETIMALCRASCLLLTCLAFVGCASGPYQAGSGWKSNSVACCDGGSACPTIAQGRPHKFVDGVGWVVGIPSKVLLWDRRANNHAVSEETVSAVAGYLEQNELQDVCVRVNQYAPGEEWRRLTENKNVGAGWRYTLGTLSLVHYTILPGRIIGGDRYNPYTNSLYVYSDIPSLAIQRAAYAKDVHSRDYPGTYAAANELPVVGLWHETINTNDALAYVNEGGEQSERLEAKRILHPSYGMRVGGAVDDVLGIGPVFQLGGAVVGHVTGRWNSNESSMPAGEIESQPQIGEFDVALQREEVPVMPISR